jgi:hypothetical protein
VTAFAYATGFMALGVSPEGSAVQVSVWDTVEHATQLDCLTEMTVDARGEAEAVGVVFTPIVNYPTGKPPPSARRVPLRPDR